MHASYVFIMFMGLITVKPHKSELYETILWTLHKIDNDYKRLKKSIVLNFDEKLIMKVNKK